MDINQVTNERIFQEVMVIHVKIAELQLSEAARVEREKVISDMTYSHDRSINGNGKPGLKSDTQKNTIEISVIQTQLGRINWLGAIVTSAIILDVISRIYSK